MIAATETEIEMSTLIVTRRASLRLLLGAALLALALFVNGARAKAAAPAPAWHLTATSLPTNFVAGESPQRYFLVATNVGGAPAEGSTITLADTLPTEIVPTQASLDIDDPAAPPGPCSIVGQTVTCTDAGPIHPGRHIALIVKVAVGALASGTGLSEATVEGGGGAPAFTQTPMTISASSPAFGFLPGPAGLSAPFTSADGSAATQAGSHPQQQTVDVSFPTRLAGDLVAAGHLRDIVVDLPPGEVVNPSATPVRCTEAQLFSEGNPGCPDSSQIGTATVTTIVGGPIGATTELYNMVPPLGAASSFGFNAIGTGIFIHILGGVRSGSDYGLSGSSYNVLARPASPVFGVKVQLWGDPSSATHDEIRGACRNANGKTILCPVERTHTALLTAPSKCTGLPNVTVGHTASWEEPSAIKSASYESSDLIGTPVSVNGCNQLQFEPSIEAKPTTNLADSPSGLDVKVHQPQNEDFEGLSPAIMRDIRLTLPEGMSVNPSSADGLDACAEADSNVHSQSPSACPDASKLGTVEVTTPLLNHPLPGALYLAKPYQNPFGSLLALYLSVSDPQTGVVANLPGKVTADPTSGELVSSFEENPQLPIEDVKVHLFTGPRAALRTPPTCGTYASKADLTPWSAPETADAHLSDFFAIQATPNGGACPTEPSQLPNSPSFSAGTITPQAGAYSPFVLKLTRGDDTQAPQRIDTTLAPGLIGKLAGISYCSEAQIAQALSRSHPEEGKLEQGSPSCPASSEVGTLDVAAGAGITPLHVTAHAYLAGPYKGAPLSLAIVTPAVAGPFDLGAVTVRTALYLDSETAQIRAVSDPLPAILEGIPLDVRQISLKMGRPNFTLNPTSCDPKKIDAAVLSTLGQSAALSNPFQVGGCADLPFKPKLSLRLEGQTKRTGHPALTAVASFKAGQANTRFVQVALPRSEFLDQAHIGTVCTRVQFTAEQCPQKSIYGKAKAITPLLDQPLEGPVYLRSSSHELPDLVIALSGQVDVTLAGRIDSVKGAIRTTFEATPDAPVSKFTLQMQGGRKGLLINSANLCKLSPKQTRAVVEMEGQNGKVNDFEPVLKSSCAKKRAHGKAHKHHQR